ncbi:hypothetical protein WMF20_17895 [Sorangium sp. So ce834]|uniref:hypothetical protein n=1 Tax=Sorangium sp. So ce834 TaxID=3133321 RepID=UPI003F63F793
MEAGDGEEAAAAMGHGADTNGLGAQAGPRGAGAVPVSYALMLWAGLGTAVRGDRAVIFDRQVSGERVHDTDVDGMAHYGLLVDWVEEVRIEGGRSGDDRALQLRRSVSTGLSCWCTRPADCGDCAGRGVRRGNVR